MQALHLLTGWLVWRVSRRLGLSMGASFAGAVFFTLSTAAIDAYWKPMFVFDVLCATFSLGTLLLYLNGRWIFGLLTFWLAYKSKELAVMFPLVLLCCEAWFGARRWWRLTPYLAISLLFGLQGVLLNHRQSEHYLFQFSWAALSATVPFYASRLLLVPYAGLVLLALPALVRDRRLWLGTVAALAFLLPLLFLPGRMLAAYTYLPLTGVALVVAAVAARAKPAALAIVFALWLPWQIRQLRIDRRATLAIAEEARPYLQAIEAFAKTHPLPPAIVYDAAPIGYAHWGVEGAFRCAWHKSDLDPVWGGDPRAAQLLQTPGVLILSWDRLHRTAHLYRNGSRPF